MCVIDLGEALLEKLWHCTEEAGVPQFLLSAKLGLLGHLSLRLQWLAGSAQPERRLLSSGFEGFASF